MTVAPPRGQTPDLIDVEALFADPQFAVPSISPDGTRIAYVAPHRGRLNIWVRGIDQDHADAVPVTHDTRRGITQYHWTDDPRWLLHLQDTDGNEDWHLHRVDLDEPGAPAVDLTPMDPGSRVIGVEPFPPEPGTVLVWMNRRPLFIDAFRVDVATGGTTVHVEQPDPAAVVLLDRAGRPAFLTRPADAGTIEISALDAGAWNARRYQHARCIPVSARPLAGVSGANGTTISRSKETSAGVRRPASGSKANRQLPFRLVQPSRRSSGRG